MTDKESSVDKVRDHATDDDSPHAHRAPGRRRWADFLKHRWPTAVGVLVAALTAYDLEIDAGSVSSLAALVVAMPLVYVGAVVVDRRRFAWTVLLAAIAALALTQAFDLRINLPAVFLVAALAFLVLGAVRGQMRSPGGLTLQAAGMLVFGATALAALYVDLDLGGYLLAAGLIGHAAWDAYHYLRNRVVTRSYAECCAVVDLLVGAAILFLA